MIPSVLLTLLGLQLLAGPGVDDFKLEAELTLQSFLAAVDANHPKLKGAEALRSVAAAKRLEKSGAFDPVLNFGSDFIRYNSTTTRGKQRETAGNELSLDFVTRSGLKFYGGVRLNLGTVKSPLSSTGDTGEYFLGVKLPLLRNAGINEKAAAERQAFLGEDIAEAEFYELRRNLLMKAAMAYWEWVGAARRLDLARRMLELARVRAEAVRERALAGDLPIIDSVEAEQEVQRRLGAQIKAERDLQKAAFKLGEYLWDSNGNPAALPSENTVPRRMDSPRAISFDEQVLARSRAIMRRPELRIISLNRKVLEIDRDLARNQVRPAVDFSFSPGIDTGLGSIGNTLKAGLDFSFTFRQRAAEGRIGQAEYKMRKLDFEDAETRRRISLEVDDAVSAVNTGVERYKVALRELDLAIRLEEGEREKFLLGDSTIFLVNQRERSRAEAEIKLIDVYIEYQIGMAAYKAATNDY
ncbi:MAG: TolC family protein [Acidobacteriota bacterium]|nr:TolC family protein [Blastocatellia bacterium]MDW8413117.1 TolC family protein [Acidobacteriota bacterium]